MPRNHRYYKEVRRGYKVGDGRGNITARTVRKGPSEELTTEYRPTCLQRVTQINIRERSLPAKGREGPESLKQRKIAFICTGRSKSPVYLVLRQQGREVNTLQHGHFISH